MDHEIWSLFGYAALVPATILSIPCRSNPKQLLSAQHHFDDPSSNPLFLAGFHKPAHVQSAHTIGIRSRSSSALTSRRRPPGAAPSDYGNPRDGNDRDDTIEFRNNQSPPDTPSMESPEAEDWHRPTTSEDGAGEAWGGGLLGKEFDDEVDRQRASEVAAEWGRKRGSGKRTKTREKVRQPSWRYPWPRIKPSKRWEEVPGLLAV